MKLANIKNSISRSFHKVGFKAKKHSPELLVGAGIVGVVGAGVLACRATLKINDVLDERDETIEKIENYVEEKGYSDEYTEEDHKKDVVTVKVQTGVKLAKLYAPAVILGAASITAIVSSHRILTKRNAALAAAYATVDKCFHDYRERVVERFGKELDHELRYNIKSKEFETVETDEKTGEETVKKEVVSITDNPNDISDFARFFDESCEAWTKDPEHNMFFLKSVQAHFNDKLKAEGRVFLNDVYKALGMQPSKAGHVVGWVYDEKNPVGDNYIDFGLYNMNREAARNFVNGYERTILLDFNIDGNVWELM